jgi:hypothetical protein
VVLVASKRSLVIDVILSTAEIEQDERYESERSGYYLTGGKR